MRVCCLSPFFQTIGSYVLTACAALPPIACLYKNLPLFIAKKGDDLFMSASAVVLWGYSGRACFCFW